jgi:small subunit ribosomal protein S8
VVVLGDISIDLRCVDDVLEKWLIRVNYPESERQAGKNMSMDRTSNMLSSIKNIAMAGRDFIEIRHTKECEAIAKVLQEKGYLEGVKSFKQEKGDGKMLHIGVVKEEGVAKLSQVKIISKPGRRIYRSFGELRPVLQGIGVMVISTSRGIMSGQEARKKKLGGEVICEVY